MKYLAILAFTLFLTKNTLARAIQGQTIDANKINNMGFQVGDIKHSILNIIQFQAKHGNCWRQLDGSSISGTELSTIIGESNLPNATGRFLRNAGGDAAEIRQIQDDAIKAHNHSVNDPGHRHIEGTSAVNGNLRYGYTTAPASNRRSESGSTTDFASFTQTVSTGISINNFGSAETRPKNLTVNMFVKVDDDCN